MDNGYSFKKKISIMKQKISFANSYIKKCEYEIVIIEKELLGCEELRKFSERISSEEDILSIEYINVSFKEYPYVNYWPKYLGWKQKNPNSFCFFSIFNRLSEGKDSIKLWFSNFSEFCENVKMYLCNTVVELCQRKTNLEGKIEQKKIKVKELEEELQVLVDYYG